MILKLLHNWAMFSRIMMIFLLTTFLLVGIGWIIFALSKPEVLPIRRVQVEGNFQYIDTKTLENAIAPWAHGGFFNVDMQQIQQVILSIPWIAHVSIQRLWPDTLLVQVTEEEPAAYWGDNGLLNVDGKIFYPELDTLEQKLVHLSGPDEQAQQVLARYQEMYKLLTKLDRQLTRLSLSERHAWQIELDGGMIINLGREDIGDRFQRFTAILPTILAHENREMAYADLRYTNGIAIEWR